LLALFFERVAVANRLQTQIARLRDAAARLRHPVPSRMLCPIGQPEPIERNDILNNARDWDMRIALLGAFEKFLRFLTPVMRTEDDSGASGPLAGCNARHVAAFFDSTKSQASARPGFFPAVRRGASKSRLSARFQEIVALFVPFATRVCDSPRKTSRMPRLLE